MILQVSTCTRPFYMPSREDSEEWIPIVDMPSSNEPDSKKVFGISGTINLLSASLMAPSALLLSIEQGTDPNRPIVPSVLHVSLNQL